MNLKFGDRVRGKDGTHRKVTDLAKNKVGYIIGLMGEQGSCSRKEFEDWAADDSPESHAPADALG